MTISYPLSLPNQNIAAISIRSRNVVARSESRFSLAQKVYTYPGQNWEATVKLPPMNRGDAEDWIGFLMSLKGGTGTFLMGDPSGATARGSAGTTPGTPVVNGADQTGGSLSIDGLPISATGYLKAGDYIQLGSGDTATLHKVLTDTDSNGSGEATLDIWPDVPSTAPADNATVTVADTVGRWRLIDPGIEWDISAATIYGITFAAMGAVP